MLSDRRQIAIAFAGVPAISAAVSARLYERMPSTPPDEFRHLDNPTAPSDHFPGSFPLRIAACPERLPLSTRGRARTSGLARQTTSVPAIQTLKLPKARSAP